MSNLQVVSVDSFFIVIDTDKEECVFCYNLALDKTFRPSLHNQWAINPRLLMDFKSVMKAVANVVKENESE